MLFGAYDPSSLVPTQSIAQVAIDCSTPASLTLLAGTSRTTGSIGDRRMRHRSRAETLAYNLFSDAARTQVWGDGSSGRVAAARVERRSVLLIYGQIFAGQDAWVGEYEDTVSITVLP